jgi:hypothetical protein
VSYDGKKPQSKARFVTRLLVCLCLLTRNTLQSAAPLVTLRAGEDRGEARKAQLLTKQRERLERELAVLEAELDKLVITANIAPMFLHFSS